LARVFDAERHSHGAHVILNGSMGDKHGAGGAVDGDHDSIDAPSLGKARGGDR
jgi:hypothetical protein